MRNTLAESCKSPVSPARGSRSRRRCCERILRPWSIEYFDGCYHKIFGAGISYSSAFQEHVSFILAKLSRRGQCTARKTEAVRWATRILL